MTSRQRIAKALHRLEQQAQQRQESRREDPFRTDEQRRWEQTLNRFFEALPEDLRDRVAEALEDESCPLWEWIEGLFRGRCRLPEGLDEELLRRLVLIRLEEPDDCDSLEAVCLRCGLQYPRHKVPPVNEWRLAPGCSPNDWPLRYNLPHFFDHDGCPACGASSKTGDMNWSHLVQPGYWFVG